jgi:hypothetical protein
MEVPRNLDFSFIRNKQVESDIRGIINRYWRFNNFDLAWEYFESKVLSPHKDGTLKRFAFHGAGWSAVELIESGKNSHKFGGLVAILEKDLKKIIKTSFPVPVISIKKAPHLDVDYIIITSKPSETSMINDLLQLGVDKNKIVKFPDIDTKFLSNRVEAFLKAINEVTPGGKRILFVSIYSQNIPLMEIIVRGLKANTKHELFGVYLFEHPDKKIFDHMFFCNGSLRNMVEILTQINVDLIYIQGHGLWTVLSPLIRAICSDIPIVHEVNDWVENIIDDRKDIPEKEQIFKLEELRPIRFSERFIRNETDGFIYKDGGGPMKELLKTSSAPALQFLPYFPRSWMIKTKKKLVEKPRLVFAGTVGASGSSRIYEDIKLLSLAQDLMSQGFPITIYNNSIYSKKYQKAFFCDYIDEAKDNPLFEFNSGIPLPDIISLLAESYEYGLMLYYFNDELLIGQEHLKASMASKIFTYLAAGIPILLSEELENMAELINKHRIGIVMSRKDIGDMQATLAKYSYVELQENVRAAQHELCLEKHMHKFINFIESII